MSRKVIYILTLMCMLAPRAYGSTDGVYADDILSAYDMAVNMNESRNYLEAYRMVTLSERNLDEALSEMGIRPEMLGDDEYRYPYWAIKKSKAEIAYMLGLNAEMDDIAAELYHTLSLKEKNSDWEQTVTDGMQADLEKINGSRYFLSGDYASAEAALFMALQKGEFFGNDMFVGKVRDDLAQIYYKQEMYDKALAQLDSLLMSPLYCSSSRHRETQANIMTVESQHALCLAREGRYDEALREIDPVVDYFRHNGDTRSYAEALRKKAKILMLRYDTTGQYDKDAIKCYKDYLSLSRDFIDGNFAGMSESEREQYWMAERPFVTDCFRLEDKNPALLYDVALYSKAVLLQMGRDLKAEMTEAQRRNILESTRTTWQMVKDRMPAKSCAIEFVVYEKARVEHIGAVVLKKESAGPEFVEICPVSDLSDHPLDRRLTVKDALADTQDRWKINALYTDSILPGKIWTDGLVAAIGDSRDIYFSPDGILHQIGIEYTTPGPIKDKSFHRLTTTRLLAQEKRPLRSDRMLACGAVEYGLTMADNGEGNDGLAYSLLAPMGLRLSPLSSSAVELDSITSVRHRHTGDKILRADSITEASLQALLGKYHIVHLSTHGLFSDAAVIGTDIRPSATDTQLSRSCLFLSGAEKNLGRKGFDMSQHDGVLSARELAKTDMEDVDLVVMSACMSGLGYITPDGVYGLQRGLKSAGVRSVIASLWSVDDEATCFFIIELYKNLENEENLHDAFAHARDSLMKYEKTYGNADTSGGSYMQKRRTLTIPKFNKPYFYNAFILIDDI